MECSIIWNAFSKYRSKLVLHLHKVGKLVYLECEQVCLTENRTLRPSAIYCSTCSLHLCLFWSVWAFNDTYAYKAFFRLNQALQRNASLPIHFRWLWQCGLQGFPKEKHSSPAAKSWNRVNFWWNATWHCDDQSHYPAIIPAGQLYCSSNCLQLALSLHYAVWCLKQHCAATGLHKQHEHK